MDRETSARRALVHRGDDAAELDLPAPTPQYRRHAWRVFQRALDPLARPRPLPLPIRSRRR